ncbi:hypothetical protein ERO13_D08G255400v2 [Gossypium hirsutum]|uniref:Diacylglycerol kinase n=3 Tax=Gossypium TaxID=3633 RepID=A0A1U8LP19_GOSHI|nr:diacylglycerol kinase 4 [Gossypium hirsutum]KAB2019200.1 hypothetical protein ES319_D08G281700v1 [Gossypium barbadense]KAG4136061.1 hypothetical protein ERO13_D08G255400v2 [Gossypium hirsutum]TYG59332.1 hypothetical protein ES288_D08G293800v1 [Gossypium darwinii]
MAKPSSEGDSSTASRTGSRSTMGESSLKGCGFSSFTGFRAEKEDVLRLAMPLYLRLAMLDCIKKKDVDAGDQHFQTSSSEDDPCENPVVVFINPKSGGRNGSVLQDRLQHIISQEQVFDLHNVKPDEFVRYGLGCLEKRAEKDNCAKETRKNIRVVVAGGDGTVGWVLGCLGVLHEKDQFPVPPVAIIPLGTGNDLARSFGWGGSFPFSRRSAIKRALQRATNGRICHLDSWHVVVQMPGGEVVDPPHSLKTTEVCDVDQNLKIEGRVPDKVNCYEGVFYNYFSIGMDAQVAYGFHHLRNEKPYLAQGPISNKIIYSGYSCSQGWFLTPCMSDPSLRGLNNILSIHIKRKNSSKWEPIEIPRSVRAIVALNLHSYGSGRNPWGNLKPDYLQKRGFVEAHVDDGILEIFGLKQGWHASFVMVELISAKHIAQASSIRLELSGGDWRDAFLQMDGEPWKQPMSKEYSTIVEIKRVPFPSVMVNGE